MGSFYGNSGISSAEAETKIKKSIEQVETDIEDKMDEAKNHIIVSKTEPTVQKAGDVWFVIVSDD